MFALSVHQHLNRFLSGTAIIIIIIIMTNRRRRNALSAIDNDQYENKLQTLTEAAELTDNICKADVGDTFQLAADVGRDGLSTHMSWFDISRYQRHDGVLWAGGPNPVEENMTELLKKTHIKLSEISD